MYLNVRGRLLLLLLNYHRYYLLSLSLLPSIIVFGKRVDLRRENRIRITSIPIRLRVSAADNITIDHFGGRG